MVKQNEKIKSVTVGNYIVNKSLLFTDDTNRWVSYFWREISADTDIIFI